MQLEETAETGREDRYPNQREEEAGHNLRGDEERLGGNFSSFRKNQAAHHVEDKEARGAHLQLPNREALIRAP